ncbi:MAG: putative Ig domain-containing protein [Sphingobacteriales bacterium]|nr:putative Ig domain-containing protein [Sphingobacteriales bacterium]
MSIDTTTGIITGSPVASGVYKATIVAANAGGTDSKQLTFVVNNPGNAFIPIITSALTAKDSVGRIFTYTITANDAPTKFGATGLPDSLSIDTTTGVITGKLTAAGTYSITISAGNAAGKSTSVLVLNVYAISVQSPYHGTPANIPGTIEAEDYDLGGDGLA